MHPLDKTLRSKLEKTIKEARDIAEAAARAAVEQLGVGEASPYSHLSEDERTIRRKLRAHGRQLGDLRDSEFETQEIEQLVEEVAYEHWHRMLFARFLAENNLLMYPDPDDPVAVSLEECEDLAADEGAQNGWEMAARFAALMLPQIFRPDSPVFQLNLPPEHQHKLERLLEELPHEVFTASDSLGWVYQFWQAKKKKQINDAGIKIRARELPVVTQLFTEDYMVSFLLDNSLGAWWVAKLAGLHEPSTPKELRPGARQILQTAEDEEELRQFFSIPWVPLEYLRFVKNENGEWRPASGTFDAWPQDLAELKTLDPCCGSGHFLVAAFLMLLPMRMTVEELSAREAVDAVLSQNIHGLEIDQRCVELAAFALALNAWRYPEAGGYRPLPEMNLACSGLTISARKEEWLNFAGGDKNLRLSLGEIYQQFQDAAVLGSLINPEAALFKGKTLETKWEDIGPLLHRALSVEKNDERIEMGVVVQGLAQAAKLLSGKYHLLITNVPYLKRGKQGEILRNYCETHYPEGKNDIATVFLERCLEFCDNGGSVSVVLPQNWLFLGTYTKLRENLLKKHTWHSIARLGSGAFETISGEVVKAILFTISRGLPDSKELGLFESSGQQAAQLISGLDISSSRSPAEKTELLKTAEIKQVEQAKQLENPDARVTFDEFQGYELLAKYAGGLNGMHGADSLRFRFGFWEITDYGIWHFFQCTHPVTEHYGGKEYVFYWKGNGQVHRDNPNARVQGDSIWGKAGVVISMMRELPATLYSGDKFDISCTPIVPHNPGYLPAIWCFCSSPEYNEAVREIDQKLNVTNATLVKVPFDIEHWQEVAAEKYPNGLPKPYSDDPTQWIFHGHPAKSEQTLQVAVARLLGYRWPAELDTEMELSEEARKWVKKCDELLFYADTDGIVCIPSVRGEAPAADRLLNLLAAAYGKEWSNDKLSELLVVADHAGKTLESWLRDKFFLQHCKTFQHRPFIWHIWDGLPDGFAALLNYHKLDYKNLETFIYTYLSDWINRQKDEIASGVDGAQERLAAAESLKKKLEMILEGETPYDIFVRWKPIDAQAIGWNPDLNDGVRLNIRPFMKVSDVKKKDAGVLRDKPNIKWNKDRGTDVESAPWFQLFAGERINDYHLNREEKQAAREAAKEEGR